MDKTYTVFVYGSLKNGFGNHGLIEDQQYLGAAKTKDRNYLMISLGGFPAVCYYPDKFHITGELYKVDRQTLAALDRLEGNGSLYTREEKEILLGDKTVTAWIYLMPQNMAQFYYSRAGNRKADRVTLDENSLVWL